MVKKVVEVDMDNAEFDDLMRESVKIVLNAFKSVYEEKENTQNPNNDNRPEATSEEIKKAFKELAERHNKQARNTDTHRNQIRRGKDLRVRRINRDREYNEKNSYKIENLQDHIDQLKSCNKELEQKLVEYDASIKILSAENASLKTTVKQQEEYIKGCNSTVETLQNQLNRYYHIIDTIKKLGVNFGDTVNRLSKEITGK